ncbi:YdcF family protein [Pseudomonadota bacterium]
MTTSPSKHPFRRLGHWLMALGIVGVAGWLWLLPALGTFLVTDMPPREADAIVVLNTGIDYYPRLIEAAQLVKEGYASRVVINGNRKSPILRELEAAGFTPTIPWDTDRRRILNMLGVTDERILSVSVEDAYDTISEAKGVAPSLRQQGFKRLLIVTSRFHTRRAGYIWSRLFDNDHVIIPVAARKDPFNPQGWWQEGRQIKQLLAEYGGWLFYLLHRED